MATAHREWPTKAEHLRQEYIALAIHIQWLAKRQQDALISAVRTNDFQPVADLIQQVYLTGQRQQELQKEARRLQ